MFLSQIILEIPSPQTNDFHQFILHHGRVNSFQKTNNNFSINLNSQNQKEYSAFLQGIKEIFKIEKLKEIKFCQAKCRDGTNCLNNARYGNYCWKHKNSKKSKKNLNLLSS